MNETKYRVEVILTRSQYRLLLIALQRLVVDARGVNDYQRSTWNEGDDERLMGIMRGLRDGYTVAFGQNKVVR